MRMFEDRWEILRQLRVYNRGRLGEKLGRETQRNHESKVLYVEIS